MKILHYWSDIRSVVFIFSTLAAYAVQWAGICRHPALFAASLCLAFFACVINHNHQHHPTFIPRYLNRAFGVLISLAMGVPATAIIPMHNYNHHVHNNHDEDFVRAAIVRFRWNLLNLILFPVVALASYAPVKSRELAGWRKNHTALYRQLWLERLVLYPLLVSLLVIDPMATVCFVLLPQLFGQWGIVAINHIQHDGCDPDSTHNHSRNFVGRWLNWWVFNNGYHTAHHLRPGLHWSRLREFHAEIREQIDPELERRSLFLAVVEFYVWPGRRPVSKGLQT
jgi:fatty acid desaturase